MSETVYGTVAILTTPEASYLVALFLPYLVALFLTPRVRDGATALGWVDRPTERKTHTTAVPLAGGIAVFAAAAIGLLLGALVSSPIRDGLWGSGSLAALGLGVAGIVALGLYDDLYDMRPGSKALAQVAIAIMTWELGFRCNALLLPFGLGVADGTIVSLVVTVGWIVMVTNAFNLIDGIDGLSAGLGIAAALTILVLAAGNEASVPVLGALALSGALSAFLRYNLPPASIFLGDAGAMGIGYATAVLSLASYQKGPTAMVLVVPILAIGVPMLDTLLSVVRRTVRHLRERGLQGVHPVAVVRAVMDADRGHIHHLLLRSGWGVRRILFVLYGLSALCGGLALWTRDASPSLRWTLWLGLLGGSLLVLRLLESRVRAREERVESTMPAEVPNAPRAAAGRGSSPG